MTVWTRPTPTVTVAPSIFDWRRLPNRLSKRRRTPHGAMSLDPWLYRDRLLVPDACLLWCDAAYGSSNKPTQLGV